MTIWQIFTVLSGIVFVIRAFGFLRAWIRRGFWLPRYIHIMAGVGLVLGAVTDLAMYALGGGGWLAFLVIMALFPVTVYLVFILYGGANAAWNEKQDREMPQDEE